jgi:hypothetical protein
VLFLPRSRSAEPQLDAAAGVDAKVDVWEGMAHGFLGNVGRCKRLMRRS